MGIIEEIPDSPERSPTPPPPVVVAPKEASPSPPPISDSTELAHVLRSLSSKLALPEDLLPSFLNEDKPEILIDEYREKATSTLRHIASGTQQPAWKDASFDDQAAVVADVVRLHGEDPWTSKEICVLVDGITSTVNKSAMADHLLSSTLRTLFVAHPHLSATSDRARARPLGGAQAMDDVQEQQAWKSTAGWGCHNMLAWCVSVLDDSILLRRLGNVLPPTLMMMDDWEPQWRGRGAWVLTHWVGRIGADELARRGLDKLLLTSLTHTMSLHANPPLKHVLPTALTIVKNLDGKKRADAYTDIVEKDLIAGWTYAPSGAEGRPVLIAIAEDLEKLCAELGTGIARWLKSIVPSLLEPLQHPPAPAALPHFRANLSALNTVCVTLRGTERITRWRGQILDVGSRLWVQINEREYEGADNDIAQEVRRLTRELFSEIKKEYPAVQDEEFGELLRLNKDVFAPLVAAN